MFRKEVAILFIIFSMAACEVQLSCHSGQAVFLCNAEAPVLTWLIRAERNVRRYISFSSSDAIGTQRSTAVAYTSVSAEKVASSSPSVTSSSISLVLPIDPDLLSVECNGRTVFLDYSNSAYSSIERLTLLPSGEDKEVHNFTATWSDGGPHYYHWMSISPPPPHGEYPRLTRDDTPSLSFRNNVTYNITMTACPYPIITSHFSIGRCPFLTLPGVNISYVIWSNGTQSISVRCVEGREIFIECGLNGEWLEEIDDVACHQPSGASEIGADGVSRNETNTATLITDEYSKTKKQVTNEINIQAKEVINRDNASNDISILAGVSGAAVILVLVTGIIAFLLGLLCGNRMATKARFSMEERQMEWKCSDQADTQIYEELKIVEKPLDLKFSCDSNVAYGNLKVN